MTKNKILTAINGFLGVQLFGSTDINATPIETTVLEGLPLGTSDQSSTGELGAKVILIADRSATAQVSSAFLIPSYDEVDYTYYGSTNNIETATYKLATVVQRV